MEAKEGSVMAESSHTSARLTTNRSEAVQPYDVCGWLRQCQQAVMMLDSAIQNAHLSSDVR